MLLNCIYQMISFCFVYICYSKIVNNQGVTDGPSVVLPKVWCGCTLAITLFSKSFFQELLGNNAGLGQAIHSLPDLAVDKAVGRGDCSKLVMFDDIVRHVGQFQTYVLVLHHWGVKVKIFDIHHHTFCSCC
jgi:hypothetical protein